MSQYQADLLLNKQRFSTLDFEDIQRRKDIAFINHAAKVNTKYDQNDPVQLDWNRLKLDRYNDTKTNSSTNIGNMQTLASLKTSQIFGDNFHTEDIKNCLMLSNADKNKSIFKKNLINARNNAFDNKSNPKENKLKKSNNPKKNKQTNEWAEYLK